MARTKKDKLVSSVSSEKMMDSLSTEGMIDSLKKVLLAKRTLILQGAPGTGKTFIAKKIAEKLLEKDSENECLKIVQFHPSYSYEDFVRGIIATTDEKSGNLVYTPKNKLFAEFAKDAYDNYCDSKKESLAVNKQNWVNKQWEEYKEALNQKLQNSDNVELGRYNLTSVKSKNISLDSYTVPDNLVIEAYIESHINDNTLYSPKYYQKAVWTIVDDFADNLEAKSIKYEQPKGTPKDKIALKNYVLIIDEINRANLPMVLGELIYALEYRKQKVETFYDVEGDNTIIIPPNLYIIGTMNTADRSAGHIDYAIRRRFAFEYVVPRSLKEELKKKFDERLFNNVQKLFDHNTWLSSDFDRRDVAIGHSYFIMEAEDANGMTRDMRMKYEIRPLLEEYVKDGILRREFNGEKIEDKLNEILK